MEFGTVACGIREFGGNSGQPPIFIDIRMSGLLQTPIQPAVLDGFGKVHRAE